MLALAITSCSNVSTSSPSLNAVPTIAPTQGQNPTLVVVLTPTQPSKRLPATEAEVPRITVENAKAAFDNGEAIIVDVRSKQAYDVSHIAGALYIPLADMESNSPGLGLDKDQWIITYCT